MRSAADSRWNPLHPIRRARGTPTALLGRVFQSSPAVEDLVQRARLAPSFSRKTWRCCQTSDDTDQKPSCDHGPSAEQGRAPRNRGGGERRRGRALRLECRRRLAPGAAEQGSRVAIAIRAENHRANRVLEFCWRAMPEHQTWRRSRGACPELRRQSDDLNQGGLGNGMHEAGKATVTGSFMASLPVCQQLAQAGEFFGTGLWSLPERLTPTTMGVTEESADQMPHLEAGRISVRSTCASNTHAPACLSGASHTSLLRGCE